MIFSLISLKPDPERSVSLPYSFGHFEAALFDYWETLVEKEVDGEADLEKAIKSFYQKFAQPCSFPPWEIFQAEFAHTTEWVKTILASQPFEIPLDRLLRGFFHKLGLEEQDQVIERAVYYLAEAVHRSTRVLPGAKEFLQFLKQKNIKVGMVSNTQIPPFHVEDSLRQLGLLSYFDTLVLSSEFSWRKPSRRIFEEGLRRLQAKPESCIHFGDSLAADVEGAKKAGILPIQVLAARNAPLAEGELIIRDWQAARALFARFL